MHDIKDMEKMAQMEHDRRTGNDGSGYYIRTFTGKKLYWANVEAHDFDIRDIAHALAMKCRWSGHTKKFYSVAQHSCFVSWFVPDHLRLAGLMHDASEAYMPDFPSPLKWYLLDRGFTALKEIEGRVMKAVSIKFGFPAHDPVVKKADTMALATEHRDLMPPGGEEAPWMGEAYAGLLDPWGWRRAESEFLQRFRDITGQET